MKKWINNLNLKQKFLLISTFSILLVGSVSIIGMTVIMYQNNKILYRTIADSMARSSMEMESTLNNIKSLSGLIITDNKLQEKLSLTKNLKSPLDINEHLKSIQQMLVSYLSQFYGNQIDSMKLYLENRTTSTYMGALDAAPPGVMEPIMEEADSLRGGVVWTTDFTKEYGLMLTRSIRQLKDMNLQNLGTLTIFIDFSRLVDEATNSKNLIQDCRYLIYDGENPIYISEAFSQKEAELIRKKVTQPYEVVDICGRKYFAVKHELLINGSNLRYSWDYLCLVPYDSIYQMIFTAYILYFFFIGFAALMSLLLSDRLIRNITKHFDILILKMNTFRNKDMELLHPDYDYVNRADELGMIHRNFDGMAMEIKDLVEVNYVNTILVKDARLQALEAQMNPHFLYNTLESINWRAKAIGEKDISSMAEALGSLLRISLNNKDEFTLKQELELLNSYLTIQKLRYEERLSYMVLVPQELMGLMIPKLTIQPLVENAIRYGLEEITEVCDIYVIGEIADSSLMIYVKNNGSFFEENLLERLRNGDIHPHGSGIGLLNIDQRLKLTFGNEYGLSLYNEDDFAVARISIPYGQKGGEMLC